MQFIRKSALGVCVSLLFTVLLLFGLVFGLYRLFGSPGPIKHALRESGIYQSIVGDALDQAQKAQQSKSANKEEIPVDRPEVQNIIKTAVSPTVLQTQTEQALDAIYVWAQGKTPKLEFTIQLGDIKANLANGVEQYVAQHVASLPVCGPGAAAGSNLEDPFNATCRPSGVDTNQIAAQAKNQILSGDFLKETTLSADTLKTDDGKTLEQRLHAVPAMYQKVTWGVYGIGLLALLLVLGVIFLSAHRRSGLKKVSIIFIVIGAISVFVGWLSGFGVSRAATFATEPLQKSGVKVAEALAGDLRRWWMWYGIGLLVTGIVTLVVLHFTKPKTPEGPDKPAESTDEHTPEKEAADKPAMTQTARPKSPRKLVQ